ncbi:MAG TPA: Ig-like domain-containing protein, partial [Gemmatimonadales bacterium]|nr:Ig-like domain-containing protein [Gemmatimonadales bacterium]
HRRAWRRRRSAGRGVRRLPFWRGGKGARRSQVSWALQARLTAAFVDQAGKPVGPAAGVAWVTSNAGIAKVEADGTVEGVAPGRATITARAGAGAPSSATVLVTGDLLLTSTRSGRLGIYTTLARAPEQFIPLVADTFGNHLDGAYSPDRSRVAYASDRLGAGNYDIFVADADGRNPVRLTTEGGMDLQPHWTPDGQSLVFVSLRGGARQLYLMNADGSNVRALTSLPGGAEEPAISPDGRTVAFTGYTSREAPGDIYVVPLAGGVPQPVTATKDRRENRPLYLPSGDLAWVLHRKDRREPEQVLQQAAGGGPPVALVSTDLTLMDIALARDGARIAWVASRPADKNRVVPEFTLQWRALPGGVETSVRLLPGERITSPAF